MILSLIYALHVLIGKYLLNLSGIQLVSLIITCVLSDIVMEGPYGFIVVSLIMYLHGQWDT